MHRRDMSSRFKTRIDYIDISAYGIGKVKTEEFESAKKKKEESKKQENKLQIWMMNTLEKRLFHKI